MTPSPRFHPGEFEQMVLLAVLRLGEEAHAVAILSELDQRAGRPVSRGALYKTLDRMEAKAMVGWVLDREDVPERGGHPRRRFRVTPTGLEALREARLAFARLSEGLEGLLTGEGRA